MAFREPKSICSQIFKSGAVKKLKIKNIYIKKKWKHKWKNKCPQFTKAVIFSNWLKKNFLKKYWYSQGLHDKTKDGRGIIRGGFCS